ncbi:MAG TPA: glycosyltransferase family 39 protein [Candidatus Magasanikbacteria bacterium]|nr:glycosyltransferase family 39 protein [Candidatus Magasanikbacteria bacterium]
MSFLKDKKTWFIAGLIIIQFFLSFIFPAFEADNSCQHSADYFLNTNAERMSNIFSVSSGEVGLTKMFFTFFPNYRVICDSMSFLFLAKDWPWSYLQRNIYIDHPLYNFFAFLLIKPAQLLLGQVNYPVIFGAFMAVNYVLFFLTALFLYRLFKELLSEKVGFLSTVLFIFSPFSHSMINQPTSSGAMEVFVVMSALFLLWLYYKKPNSTKLLLFSLLFGFLMLGKQIAALILFILILSIYFKRIKEGLVFVFIQFIPTVLWYLFVRLGLGLPFLMINVSSYDQGTWFLKSEYWTVAKMGHIILTALPNFFGTVVYGFFLIPLVLAVYGLYKIELKHKYLISALFCFSFLALFIGMKYFRPSLTFLIFPLVYPAAAYAIFDITERLKIINKKYSVLFFYGILLLIFLISNGNIYDFGVWQMMGV